MRENWTMKCSSDACIFDCRCECAPQKHFCAWYHSACHHAMTFFLLILILAKAFGSHGDPVRRSLNTGIWLLDHWRRFLNGNLFHLITVWKKKTVCRRWIDTCEKSGNRQTQIGQGFDSNSENMSARSTKSLYYPTTRATHSTAVVSETWNSQN